MRQFKSIADVMIYFSDPAKCIEFFEKRRWPDGKIYCPKCGAGGAYRNSDMKTYKCREKACKARFSVTVGTVMENTKIPLSKWIGAMYLLTNSKKGRSSCQVARDLDIRQKAAWFLLMRIREMVRNKAPHLLQHTVEVDEHYVGGAWGNMSKKKRAILKKEGKDTKTPVMGLVERGGEARLTVIGDNTFKEVIRQNVSTDAYLNTDEHKGYKGLNKEFADHSSVNHSHGEMVRDDVHIQRAENLFSIVARTILGTYHMVSPKHLGRYCDEIEYRYNTRKEKDPDRFIGATGRIEGRLTYKRLIDK